MNVLEQLRDSPEPADDATPAVAPPAETASAADSAEPTNDAAAARKARLAELAAQDRKRVDEKQRQAAGDKAAREAETLRKELEALKAREAVRIDPDSLKDPKALLRFARENNIAPQALGEALRDAIADPEAAAIASAREEARKALDPEVKALRDEIAALKARDEERERVFESQRQQAAEQQAANEFFAFTETNAENAPRAAAFLKNIGPGEFYKLAVSAVRQVPEGAGPQAILDVIEENLSQLAIVYGSQQPTPSKAPSQTRAAAKATTVSNALAGQRATVVEEEDFASLPFDERVRRVKQRH